MEKAINLKAMLVGDHVVLKEKFLMETARETASLPLSDERDLTVRSIFDLRVVVNFKLYDKVGDVAFLNTSEF